MMKKLDDTDVKILHEIQRDCSLSYDRISEKVNLSPTSCLRRIHKLEKAGFIEGRHAFLNKAKLGFGVEALISVELSQDVLDLSDRLSVICDENPQIQQCYIVSSQADFIVIAVFRDAGEFTTFLDNLISIFHNLSIREYDSSLVVKSVANRRELPLLQ